MSKKFISFEQSLEIIGKIDISSPKTEKLTLGDSLNRILGVDVIAQENSPKQITSAMDGYAIMLDDIDDELEIISDNPAGNKLSHCVSKSKCIKTFTGSLMPKGSDTLVPIENVEVSNNKIQITTKVPKYFAIRNIGENYKFGEILIKAGTKINFAEIGVMASLNIASVEVYKKPKIAIASTGNEIIEVGQKPEHDGQIISSNHHTLEAIAKNHGACVLQKGIVKDDKKSILNLIQNSLKEADIVVTTGGVSVGDYDFVKDIIEFELDAKVIFKGVLVKPGQHIVIAKKDDKFIVGLPGFAYSSTVTFLLYVIPLLDKFSNQSKSLKIVDATIRCDRKSVYNKTVFSACNVVFENGAFFVDFEGKKDGSSAILTNMLGQTGLLIQEPHSDKLSNGSSVKVLLTSSIL